MSDFIRETLVGQIIRWATGNRFLLYPEEQPDFQIPEVYSLGTQHDTLIEKPDERTSQEDTTEESTEPENSTLEQPRAERPPPGLEWTSTLSQIVSRHNVSKVATREDLEAAYRAASLQESIKLQPSRPIVPVKTADGTILVDWYTTDDPANPQNWKFWTKFNVVFQIYQYAAIVYMGSAIFAPSEPQLMEIFGVSQSVASLGLGMYVLGYGIGPLLFSPLSEVPFVGRNLPYMVSYLLFVLISIPTALVEDIPGLMALRFLQGFFGSPCVATAGASLADVTNLFILPYLLFGWAMSGLAGPAIGPIIAGFAVVAEDWHWSMWELLWASAPSFFVFLICLPETSTATILLRRAQRLRQLTGNNHLKSQSEIEQAALSLNQVAYNALVIPWKINILDPAILFSSIYTGLVYAIFYSFFEIFPLVYMDIYGLNLGEMGLAFLTVPIGVAIAMSLYYCFLFWVVNPQMRIKGLAAPEQRLLPALVASIIIPIGLFIFGFTSRPSIHWIVPSIGAVMISGGMITIIQCMLLYVAVAYPTYSAYLFAGNDFARSSLAFAAIMWSGPMFHNLGVDRGCSLLAGLTIGCIGGVIFLYFYGAKLRARSKFAV